MAENKTEFLITARDETREAFRSVESGLGRVNSALGGMLGPLAALTGVAGFGALIKSQIDLGDQLYKTSQKLGIAVEDLSAYQYAAKLSDVSNEQLTGGLAKLAKTMQDAASNKTGEAAIAFRALGVSVADAAGNLRPINLVLDEVGRRFEETRDGTNKTAMAMQLFGRSGAELVPLLNSMRSLSEEAYRTGNIVSTDFAKKSEQLNDSFVRMEKAAGNFARTLAGAVVPALASMIERLNVAIGAQESLSIDLLQKDKDFLQVEYGALMQAAEKGYIINTNRAEFLKKQIDEIDAKIAAAESKAAVAVAAATQGTAGGTMPEMPSISRQGDVKGIGDMEALQTALYLEELGKQLAALNQATSFRGEALTSWYTFETEADWANYLRKEEELNAWVNKEYELLQVGYQNQLLSKEQMNIQMLQLDQAYADKKLKLEDDLSKKQTAGKQRFQSIDLGALQYMTGQMANMMQGSSKKQFEIGKKAAIANTLISTFQGAMDAFKALAGIPYVGPFMGAAAAAGVIAMGMGNVSRIRSQQFGGGGGGGGAVPTFNDFSGTLQNAATKAAMGIKPQET